MRCEWYPRRDGQLYASEATGGFWPIRANQEFRSVSRSRSPEGDLWHDIGARHEGPVVPTSFS